MDEGGAEEGRKGGEWSERPVRSPEGGGGPTADDHQNFAMSVRSFDRARTRARADDRDAGVAWYS